MVLLPKLSGDHVERRFEEEEEEEKEEEDEDEDEKEKHEERKGSWKVGGGFGGVEPSHRNNLHFTGGF